MAAPLPSRETLISRGRLRRAAVSRSYGFRARPRSAFRRDIAVALRGAIAIGAIQAVFRVKRIANANTASRARALFHLPLPPVGR